MIIILKVLVVLICAILWRLGGWDKSKWSGYRDVLIPIILGAFYAITYTWWIGLLVCGATNIIRMGYGVYNPESDKKSSFLAKITKDKEGWKIRGIYGAITSFMIGLFPTLYYAFNVNHYQVLIVFVGYILLNATLEIYLNRTKVNPWITELSNGLGRSLIIFLVG